MDKDKEYRQCKLSVMDNIADPDIRFDSDGVCNYYHEYQEAERSKVYKGEEGLLKLEQTVDKIRKAGKGKTYDCIMGLSGGVDSTYLAIVAKQCGLRPLAVHMDNGWNSEIAVKNIDSLVNRMGIDLHTLVVDWEEFRDIQLSFLKASVIDIEMVTDHAITGAIARMSRKFGLKYSLTGNNVVSEQVMPPSWIFNKNDHVNLSAIHERFGTIPIRTYPLYNTFYKKYLNVYLGAESVPLLNYTNYVKEEAKRAIGEQTGWRDYGGKHYESIFTKFYQAYILPEKFKVDKRKAHLSTLIFSGQITKVQALRELEKPLYTQEGLKLDYEFVLKKLELTSGQFEELMKRPLKSHCDYPIERPLAERYRILRLLKLFR